MYAAPSPSPDERYCAWYGDARDGVLYFGQAAFWSAQGDSRAAPEADLAHAGPVLVGRFDLTRERFLPPLEVGAPGDRSGVWDVLAHPSGRLFFTRFFETSGLVELASGRVQGLPDLGTGLNELAPGPGDRVLVSRYGGPDAGRGVLVLDLDGGAVAEHPLAPPEGYEAAPKTVAWDPLRRELWVTTDLLPRAEGAIRHDAFVLDARGRELRRIARPELQFAAFAPDGRGYRAEVEHGALWLVARAAGASAMRRLLLDRAFPGELDFVQDIQIASDGRAAVTRWSGRVHVVDARGAVRTLQLPALEPGGLYYTAVLNGDRLCATYCAGVTLVCADVF